MKRSTLKSLLTVAVAMGLAASARADLWYTFDSGLPTTGGQFTGGEVGWNSSLQAAQFTGTTGGWNVGGAGPKFEFAWPDQTIMQGIAAAGDGRVAFDIFTVGDGSANDSFLNAAYDTTWFQIHFAFNGNGAGWTQDPAPYAPNPISSDFSTVSGATQSLSVDLPFSAAGWTASTTWFQIFFGSNSGGADPVNFYIDNIHVYEVPEPATLALLGLGAAGLLVFRRK